MNWKKVIELLNARVLVCEEETNVSIDSVCGSDLMSDVMAYDENGTLLLTGLVHVQTIRTAEMMDIQMIVFLRNKMPDPNILAMAAQKKIIVASTKYSMYRACGILWQNGLRKGEECG